MSWKFWLIPVSSVGSKMQSVEAKVKIEFMSIHIFMLEMSIHIKPLLFRQQCFQTHKYWTEYFQIYIFKLSTVHISHLSYRVPTIFSTTWADIIWVEDMCVNCNFEMQHRAANGVLAFASPKCINDHIGALEKITSEYIMRFKTRN